MKEYKVINLDLFQTLVDVNSRRHEVFKKILGNQYNQVLAEECWYGANLLLPKYFNKHVTLSTEFNTIKFVFENFYRELFLQKGIKLDPKRGAEILAYEHGYAESYIDTEIFLDVAKKHYPICLVSDADYDMVNPLLERFQFDKVFLSEELRCYKFSQYGSAFQEVLSYYKVKADEILHIGDSYSDIAGAKKLGITTCWLNRENSVWKHEIKPDYIVTSLVEVAKIIGLETEVVAY